MGLCEACGKGEAVHHVTVTLTVFGPVSTKVKRVQFWLCDDCELANAQIMANDIQQRRRLALRLTQDSEFLSRWRTWRNRNVPRALVSS